MIDDDDDPYGVSLVEFEGPVVLLDRSIVHRPSSSVMRVVAVDGREGWVDQLRRRGGT